MLLKSAVKGLFFFQRRQHLLTEQEQRIEPNELVKLKVSIINTCYLELTTMFGN